MAATDVVTVFSDIVNAIGSEVKSLKDYFNSNTKLLKIFEERDVMWRGDYSYDALETFRMGGFAFNTGDAGYDLPTPAAPNIEQVKIPLAYSYQALELPEPLIKRVEAARDYSALANYVESRTRAVLKALAMQVENAMVSKEGAFATIGTVSSQTTLTLTGIYHDNVVEIFCSPGDEIDIWDGTTKIERKITAVDPINNQITVDSAVTTSGTSYVAFKNALYNNSGSLASNSFYTIDGIIDDDNPPFRSDFEGIDASSETWWRAYVDDNSGTLRDLTLTMFDKAMDRVSELAGDEEIPKYALVNHGIRRSLIGILRTENQPTEVIVGEAGWKGIKYTWGDRNLIIRASHKVPKNSIYLINPEAIGVYKLATAEPLSVTGSATAFMIGNKPSFQMWYEYYANLGTDNRHALAKIIDLNEG